MANFVLEIFDDEGAKCSFYTVRNLNADFTETDYFIKKFKDNPRLKGYLTDLMNLIVYEIGDEYGAREMFFRPERQAQALPPKPGLREIEIGRNFPLRSFCSRLSNSCVILFNGGEKTSQTNQEGKTSMTFYEANEFAERILKAFRENIIRLDDDQKSIIDYFESEDISDIII